MFENMRKLEINGGRGTVVLCSTMTDNDDDDDDVFVFGGRQER